MIFTTPLKSASGLTDYHMDYEKVLIPTLSSSCPLKAFSIICHYRSGVVRYQVRRLIVRAFIIRMWVPVPVPSYGDVTAPNRMNCNISDTGTDLSNWVIFCPSQWEHLLRNMTRRCVPDHAGSGCGKKSGSRLHQGTSYLSDNSFTWRGIN